MEINTQRNMEIAQVPGGWLMRDREDPVRFFKTKVELLQALSKRLELWMKSFPEPD